VPSQIKLAGQFEFELKRISAEFPKPTADWPLNKPNFYKLLTLISDIIPPPTTGQPESPYFLVIFIFILTHDYHNYYYDFASVSVFLQ
jgi:hypothetical protein